MATYILVLMALSLIAIATFTARNFSHSRFMEQAWVNAAMVSGEDYSNVAQKRKREYFCALATYLLSIVLTHALQHVTPALFGLCIGFLFVVTALFTSVTIRAMVHHDRRKEATRQCLVW